MTQDVRRADPDETGLSVDEIWQGMRDGVISGPRAWARVMRSPGFYPGSTMALGIVVTADADVQRSGRAEAVQ